MTKRLIVILVCFCILAAAVWADNAARIKELQARQQQIVAEVNERQAIIAQQEQSIAALREEFLRNDGAIKELQRQDEEAKKLEKPEKAKAKQ